jgi:histone H3/H4
MSNGIPKAPIKQILKDQGIERVSDEIVDVLKDEIEASLIKMAKKIKVMLAATDSKTAKVKHLRMIKEL